MNKAVLNYRCFSEYCEISKDTYFEELLSLVGYFDLKLKMPYAIL